MSAAQKPRWVRFLETYKVVFELVGSAATVISIVALVLAFQSNESAKRALALQLAGLQPVVEVYWDPSDLINSLPFSQYGEAIYAVSARGTFRDASARERTFAVFGTTTTIHDENDWPPDNASAVVPLPKHTASPLAYWADVSFRARDPRHRGVEIAGWEQYTGAANTLDSLRTIWDLAAGRRAAVEIVTFIEVDYVDAADQEQHLYFKVGGRTASLELRNSNSGRLPLPQPNGGYRAPTTTSACSRYFDRYASDAGREFFGWLANPNSSGNNRQRTAARRDLGIVVAVVRRFSGHVAPADCFS